MGRVKALRNRLQPQKIVVYALALALPLLGSWTTDHSHSLQAIPFALQFIAVAGVAAIGGFLPATVAIATGFIERNWLHLVGWQAPSHAHYDLIRVAAIAGGGAIVALAREQRVRSQDKLQAALSELQERNADLIDSLKSNKCACWFRNFDDGKGTQWYSGSYEVFGRPFSELEGLTTLATMLHPEDRPRLAEIAELMRTAWEPVVFEHRVTWPNGELHVLEMRATRASESPCVWRGLTVDITERKRVESAVLRVEKLAAVGRLASTVAHEINNPLEAVTNLLYLARAEAGEGQPLQSYLALAEKEVARVGNITRLTLGFVRKTGVVAQVDVAEAIEDALTVLHQRLRNRAIRLERNFEPGVTISIAPQELRQVASNLIANAADAAPAVGGIISLTIRREGEHAVLLVEDNGSGISPTNLPHIFDPFFSTREEVGTGIGLWVTREIISTNDGQIAVESGELAENLTTRFRVQLPLAKEILATEIG